jgi:integrase
MGKTTKQRRANCLPVALWFEGWLETVPRGLPDQPVFKNTLIRKNKHNPDRRYVGDTLNKIWSEAVTAAEYEPIKLYNAVRHSRGNQARRDGWDVGMIARLLGHASTKYVQEYYVDTDAEMIRRQMTRTTNGLSKNSPAKECHPHTVEVTGSNPVRPTKNKNKGLATMVANPLIRLMSR